MLSGDGTLAYDVSLLDAAPGLDWDVLAEDTRELRADQIRGYDALLVFGPHVTPATLAGADRLVLLARFGVGVDRLDVEACTAHGVLITITPDGVRRPMASGALAFLLALAHRLPQKDRVVREGRWARLEHIGTGLTGRTLGIVGLGNVGRELCALAAPFAMRLLAYDPYVDAADGVELVALDELLSRADFVCLTCPLTEETHHLLDARRLALMKPNAFLVNIARGPVVDQAALTAALRDRRIAGAGLDVFEREPIEPGDALVELENVILAPHAIGLTDEIFRESGRSACEAVLAVAEGRVPRYVANPDVLGHPRLVERLRERSAVA